MNTQPIWMKLVMTCQWGHVLHSGLYLVLTTFIDKKSNLTPTTYPASKSISATMLDLQVKWLEMVNLGVYVILLGRTHLAFIYMNRARISQIQLDKKWNPQNHHQNPTLNSSYLLDLRRSYQISFVKSFYKRGHIIYPSSREKQKSLSRDMKEK